MRDPLCGQITISIYRSHAICRNQSCRKKHALRKLVIERASAALAIVGDFGDRSTTGGVGKTRSLICAPSGRFAARPSQRSPLWMTCAGVYVRTRCRCRSTIVLLPLSKTSNILSSATRTGHVSQPSSRIERTTAGETLAFERNDISHCD